MDNGDESMDSDSEEEEIYVTRQEEERDPELEAEFDRAFEKMMSESLESRKFERKTLFDVPLPMRRGRESSASTSAPAPAPATENGQNNEVPQGTMAFSLMTKRGNRQQVCHYVYQTYSGDTDFFFFFFFFFADSHHRSPFGF